MRENSGTAARRSVAHCGIVGSGSLFFFLRADAVGLLRRWGLIARRRCRQAVSRRLAGEGRGLLLLAAEAAAKAAEQAAEIAKFRGALGSAVLVAHGAGSGCSARARAARSARGIEFARSEIAALKVGVVAAVVCFLAFLGGVLPTLLVGVDGPPCRGLRRARLLRRRQIGARWDHQRRPFPIFNRGFAAVAQSKPPHHSVQELLVEVPDRRLVVLVVILSPGRALCERRQQHESERAAERHAARVPRQRGSDR